MENEKLFFSYQTTNIEGVLKDAYTSLRFKGSTNIRGWKIPNLWSGWTRIPHWNSEKCPMIGEILQYT